MFLIQSGGKVARIGKEPLKRLTRQPLVADPTILRTFAERQAYARRGLEVSPGQMLVEHTSKRRETSAGEVVRVFACVPNTADHGNGGQQPAMEHGSLLIAEARLESSAHGHAGVVPYHFPVPVTHGSIWINSCFGHPYG